MLDLAVIGDVHYYFTLEDVAYFNESDADLVLIVGDLSDFSPRKGYRVAQLISRLRKPALFIPGNHDTVNLFQLLAEIKRRPLLTRLFGLGQARRAERLRRSLGAVQFCGYSRHTFSKNGRDIDVIAARPYSMGGPRLSFIPHMKRRFGVATMEDSIARLKKLVDQCSAQSVIFLAHNGPTGLGSSRDDIWGCDFREDEGDYGDPDLTFAIQYARDKGKDVLAVVGGHMHHNLKGGGVRRWHVERDGTTYVNAARTPRIFRQDDKRFRHHIRLSIDLAQVEVQEVLIEAPSTAG